MKPGQIIVLNGVSSSGKTSLAKKIQGINETAYFHLSLDGFESMAPQEQLMKDFWNLLGQAASAMHHSAATFSDLGLNVIVDTLILNLPEEATWLPECARLFSTRASLFVGVHCPLEELNSRP